MDSKIDRLKTWIYSQEGVTINSLAKRLSCPVDILIVKVKQLTKIQPKNTDIIPRTYLITNLDSILRAVDSIHKKANIKPSKLVQKEYKSAKKKKAKVKVIQKKIDYRHPLKIDGGMLGDESGESIKPIYTGMKN